MKVPSRTISRPGSIVCPGCGRAELGTRGPDLAGCDACGQAVDETMLETLLQIVSLPDALGGHACECGHPEMRRLPDGVFHCPACGSEVVPTRPNVKETVRKRKRRRKENMLLICMRAGSDGKEEASWATSR